MYRKIVVEYSETIPAVLNQSSEDFEAEDMFSDTHINYSHVQSGI
jgi:hypothetical protein